MSADLLAEFGAVDFSNVTEPRVKYAVEDAQRSTLIAELEPTTTTPTAEQQHRQSSVLYYSGLLPDQQDDNVLFDATYEASQGASQAEDEFGKFEIPGGMISDEQQTVLLTRERPDFLGVWGSEETQSTLGVPQRAEIDTQFLVSTVHGRVIDHVAIEAEADDEWGTFEDTEQASPSQSAKDGNVSNQKITDSWSDLSNNTEADWKGFGDSERTNALSPEAPSKSSGKGSIQSPLEILPDHRPALALPGTDQRSRPTNIPPPAILLQILPLVFQSLNGEADSTAQSSASLASRVSEAFSVAARIIAGRTLRWKRDNLLAQSTKIGPAATKKTGGMKLASIDKTEGLKEEREASDAVESWAHHGHSLNAAIAKAGERRQLLTLSAKIIPRTARGGDVISSSYACALCGLRREERLPGVDVNVNDFFEEFWVEYWGHKDCVDFWQMYNSLLHRR